MWSTVAEMRLSSSRRSSEPPQVWSSPSMERGIKAPAARLFRQCTVKYPAIDWLVRRMLESCRFCLVSLVGSFGFSVRFWFKTGTTKAGDPKFSDDAPLGVDAIGTRYLPWLYYDGNGTNRKTRTRCKIESRRDSPVNDSGRSKRVNKYLKKMERLYLRYGSTNLPLRDAVFFFSLEKIPLSTEIFREEIPHIEVLASGDSRKMLGLATYCEAYYRISRVIQEVIVIFLVMRFIVILFVDVS
ncbi:predicted protein [Arabidopsis lyrata subsp. lyrata]|uniref:Predicted protein n=1 Tax=Arabidopsis lyrata subsp. lyrata TaxID=81972 RepID=D7LN35_ARALL|nr:predicted protein [Arabidopsis lyrata subsp. lyrata]